MASPSRQCSTPGARGLSATIAAQVARAKADRAAGLERAANARIVAERERRAAAMAPAAALTVSVSGVDLDRALTGGARWRSSRPRRGRSIAHYRRVRGDAAQASAAS